MKLKNISKLAAISFVLISLTTNSYSFDYITYAAQTFDVSAKIAAIYDKCKSQGFIHGTPSYSAINALHSNVIDGLDTKNLPSGITGEQLRNAYIGVLQQEQASTDKKVFAEAECKSIEESWNTSFTFRDK